MKYTVKNKVKEIITKHKYNTILMLIIFILFLITGYADFETEYKLYVDDVEKVVEHEIYTFNNEQYMHIEDLANVFKNNIHDDKIAGKLIVTTYDNIVKISKSDNNYITKYQGDIYFNIVKIVDTIEQDISVANNKIHIKSSKYIDAAAKNNRVELFESSSGEVVCFLNKTNRIKVYVDTNINNNDIQIVNVQVNEQGKTYYGYVLKKNIEYKYENIQPANESDKLILVKADNKLMNTTDTQNIDMVAINMYRLSGVNTLARLDYSNNAPNTIDVLATVNNGQKSSNYDPDIVSNMLNSQSNRENVIQQIANGVEDLAGVNLEFGDFKITDRDNYIQFIKELAAVMHSVNKIIVVNWDASSKIDMNQIIEFVDYIIVRAYSARTIYSKTSGPISPLGYVENCIKEALNGEKYENKLILEMPSYTILWTERRGTVINAEQYSMKSMEAYLRANNINSQKDAISGQNYINHTKGITTYKMWLEDDYSIIQKVNLAKKYNLAGVSIYRSGMEISKIYEGIFNCLQK